MNLSEKSSATLHRFWSQGQDHLVAGRYVAARRSLEAAEAIAWRSRDTTSLARIYLPLLEARRQIRYNAADGRILITPAIPSRESLATLFASPAATLLITADAHTVAKAQIIAELVDRAARRTSHWLEAAILLVRKAETRLVSPAAPFFNAGIPVTRDTATKLLASTDAALTLPLPPAGVYTAAPLQPIARESLLIGWEALALRWQHRHPPASSLTPWQELAWLRKTLCIDPACEPVTMRLIAVAEAISRRAN